MASGFYAYTLCNVLFLTTVWRYSILKAGLSLTPGPFVAMAVAGPASRLVGRVGQPPGRRPGGACVGWGDGLLRHAARVRPDFLGEWLGGMVILGIGAGAHLPHPERRRCRLCARSAVRSGDVVELGGATVGRSARGGDPDRDPRQTIPPRGSALLRARMAVRRWLLSGGVAGVPRAGGHSSRHKGDTHR